MKKVLMNWRYYVLAVLGFISMVGVLGMPDEDSPTWFMDMLLSKAIGFGTGYIMCRLTLYWSKRNLIPELDEIEKEEEDDLWE